MFTSTAGLTPCDFSTVAKVCRLLWRPCTTSLGDCGSLENCIDDPPEEDPLPLEEEEEGFWPPDDDEGLLLLPPPKLIWPLIGEKMKTKSSRCLVPAILLRLQTADLFDNWSAQVSAAWTTLAGGLTGGRP